MKLNLSTEAHEEEVTQEPGCSLQTPVHAKLLVYTAKVVPPRSRERGVHVDTEYSPVAGAMNLNQTDRLRKGSSAQEPTVGSPMTVAKDTSGITGLRGEDKITADAHKSLVGAAAGVKNAQSKLFGNVTMHPALLKSRFKAA